MSRSTENYGLIQPEYTDYADIEVLNENLDTIDQVMGELKEDLSDLDTTVAEAKVLVIEVASFSALPLTVNNASITADHVVMNSVLGTPSAQTGDWTVTTSAGSLTISGTISGSTTLTLYLLEKRA